MPAVPRDPLHWLVAIVGALCGLVASIWLAEALLVREEKTERSARAAATKPTRAAPGPNAAEPATLTRHESPEERRAARERRAAETWRRMEAQSRAWHDGQVESLRRAGREDEVAADQARRYAAAAKRQFRDDLLTELTLARQPLPANATPLERFERQRRFDETLAKLAGAPAAARPKMASPVEVGSIGRLPFEEYIVLRVIDEKSFVASIRVADANPDGAGPPRPRSVLESKHVVVLIRGLSTQLLEPGRRAWCSAVFDATGVTELDPEGIVLVLEWFDDSALLPKAPPADEPRETL